MTIRGVLLSMTVRGGARCNSEPSIVIPDAPLSFRTAVRNLRCPDRSLVHFYDEP